MELDLLILSWLLTNRRQVGEEYLKRLEVRVLPNEFVENFNYLWLNICCKVELLDSLTLLNQLKYLLVFWVVKLHLKVNLLQLVSLKHYL